LEAGDATIAKTTIAMTTIVITTIARAINRQLVNKTREQRGVRRTAHALREPRELRRRCGSRSCRRYDNKRRLQVATTATTSIARDYDDNIDREER
jgi:hypothetical protein